MQHDEASTCMYMIGCSGIQHNKEIICMYKTDKSCMKQYKASSGKNLNMAKLVPV